LGGEDMLIAKLDGDGGVVWASRPSGFQRDIPLCIHRQTAAPNQVYFGGYYWGAITYGGTTIDDVGNGDAMLVAGIDTTFALSTVASVTCPGSCGGEAQVFATGDAPFSYLWSTGATTTSIVGLCSGAYSVEVFDANGQVRSIAFSVGEHADPGFMLGLDDDSLWVAGGVSWQWYGAGQPIQGADGSSLVVLLTGEYHALVTDTNGCTWSTDTALVVLNVGLSAVTGAGVRLYPLPAGSSVRVDMPLAVRAVHAFDLRGRVHAVGVSGSHLLQVDALPPGAYVLCIEDSAGRVHWQRLLKE
jgi:hypothetical protein